MAMCGWHIAPPQVATRRARIWHRDRRSSAARSGLPDRSSAPSRLGSPCVILEASQSAVQPPQHAAHIQKQLTRSITSCPSPHHLQVLLARTQPQLLNQFHITAAATHLAHLLEQSPGHPPPSQPEADTPSQSGPGRPNLTAAESILQQLLPWVNAHIQAVDARGAANLLWALARLHRSREAAGDIQSTFPTQARSSQRQVNGSHSPVNGSSSNGQVVRPDIQLTSPLNMGVLLGSPATPQQTGAALRHTAVTVWQHACGLDWHHYNAQHLSNMLWAAGALQLPVQPQHVEQLMHAACRLSHSLTPQGCANILWAAAQLGVQPPQQLVQLAAELLTAPQVSPQAVSSTLWAVAQLQLRPSQAWLHSMLAAVHARLPLCGPQSLANIAWAVARLEYQPSSSWWLDLLSACSQQLPAMSARELSTLLWAVQQVAASSAGQLPPPAQWLQQAAASVRQHMASMPIAELAAASHALSRLGWQPDASCLSAWLSTVSCHITKHLTGRITSMLVACVAAWHAAGTAVEAGAVLDAACAQLAQRCTSDQQSGVQRETADSCGEEDLSLQVLTALSALSSQPLQVWQAAGAEVGVQQLLAAALQLAAQQPARLSLPQLVVVCWALAKLGVTPGSASQRKRLQQRLEMAAASHALAPKEAAMLVWVSKQWFGLPAALSVSGSLTQTPSSAQADPQLQQAASADGTGPVSASASPRPPLHAVESLVAVARVWHSSGPDTRQALRQQALELLQLVAQHSSSLPVNDVSRCLWVAARMGYRPTPAWSAAMVSRIMQAVEQGQLVPHLPGCMWSLAQLRIRPPPASVAVLLDASMHVDLQQPSQLCALLSATASWGVRPSDGWWCQLWSQPGWPALLAGAGQLPQPAPGTPGSWGDAQLLVLLKQLVVLQAPLPDQLSQSVTARLSQSTVPAQPAASGAATSQPSPPAAVRIRALTAMLQLLPVRGPAGASTAPTATVMALQAVEQCLPALELPACLRLLAACRHLAGSPSLKVQLDQLSTTALLVVQVQLAAAQPAVLLRLLWVLAQLKVRPPPDWADDMLFALRLHLRQLPAQQLARCLPLLAATGCRPSRAWLLDYMGLVVQKLQSDQHHFRQHGGEHSSNSSSSRGPSSGGGSVFSPRDLSLVSSALLRVDPQLGRQWRQQLKLVYQ